MEKSLFNVFPWHVGTRVGNPVSFTSVCALAVALSTVVSSSSRILCLDPCKLPFPGMY